MQPIRIFVTLIPALALAQLAHTQPTAEPGRAGAGDRGLDAPLHLERFVVSTAPYARQIGEVAQPVSLLDGQRLAQRQSTSLGELLSGEPGVASTYFGPGASRPILRGIGGDRLKVLENSIGTIDASTTSPDHATSLDPLLVERVEVVRGPAALLYGGNAVGGVVNVINNRIPERVPDALVTGRVLPRVESANREASGGIALEGGAGRVAWHVDGFVRDTSDIKIPGYAESARRREAEAHDHDHDHDAAEEDAEAYGRVPNTAIESDGGSVGLAWIGEELRIGAAWSGFNTFYGVPGHAHSHGGHDHDHGHDHGDHDHDHDADEGDAHEHGDEVKIDLVQRRFDLQAELTRELGFLRGAAFKLGLADYRHQELADGQVDTVFKNRGHDARLELLHQPLGGVSGAVGGQLSGSRFEAVGDEAFVPPSRTTNQAVFIYEELPLGAVTLQAGGRVGSQKIALRDGTGRSKRNMLASVSAGALWRANEDWSLGLAVARSERAPNVQERYARGPHIGTRAYEIGSEGLGVETSSALDVTLRRRRGRVTGALTGFINRFDGYVFEEPTGQVAIAHGDHFHFEGLDHPDAAEGLTVYRYEQVDARFVGLEAELGVLLYEGSRGRLDLHVAADVVRGQNLSAHEDLPRITPRRAKLGLDWTRGAFALGSELQLVDSQRRLAPNELPTDAYALLSLYGSYRLELGPTSWELFARASNLTNEEARVHNSFLKELLPLPGRSLSLGLRLSF